MSSATPKDSTNYGVPASDLWPVSDRMGYDTTRQIRAIVDQPAPSEKAKPFIAEYKGRLQQSEQAWAQWLQSNPQPTRER